MKVIDHPGGGRTIVHKVPVTKAEWDRIVEGCVRINSEVYLRKLSEREQQDTAAVAR